MLAQSVLDRHVTALLEPAVAVLADQPDLHLVGLGDHARGNGHLAGPPIFLGDEHVVFVISAGEAFGLHDDRIHVVELS